MLFCVFMKTKFDYFRKVLHSHSVVLAAGKAITVVFFCRRVDKAVE